MQPAHVHQANVPGPPLASRWGRRWRWSQLWRRRHFSPAGTTGLDVGIIPPRRCAIVPVPTRRGRGCFLNSSRRRVSRVCVSAVACPQLRDQPVSHGTGKGDLIALSGDEHALAIRRLADGLQVLRSWRVCRLASHRWLQLRLIRALSSARIDGLSQCRNGGWWRRRWRARGRDLRRPGRGCCGGRGKLRAQRRRICLLDRAGIEAVGDCVGRRWQRRGGDFSLHGRRGLRPQAGKSEVETLATLVPGGIASLREHHPAIEIDLRDGSKKWLSFPGTVSQPLDKLATRKARLPPGIGIECASLHAYRRNRLAARGKRLALAEEGAAILITGVLRPRIGQLTIACGEISTETARDRRARPAGARQQGACQRDKRPPQRCAGLLRHG